MNEAQLAALTEQERLDLEDGCGGTNNHPGCERTEIHLIALADARLELGHVRQERDSAEANLHSREAEVARLTEAGIEQTNATRSVERERDQQREDIRRLLDAYNAPATLDTEEEWRSLLIDLATDLAAKYPKGDA
jgi:hypothetical protein